MMNQHVKELVASFFKVPYHHFIVGTEKTNVNFHQDSWSPGKNSNLRIYRAWKNWPNFLRWWEGPKQRFIVQQLYVRCASSQCQSPSKWIWLRFEIKQNQWCIPKKVVILTNCEQML